MAVPGGVTKEAVQLAHGCAAFRRVRWGGSLLLRVLSASQELLGSILNLFAGFSHVLAETMGGITTDADNGQEGKGKEQESQTLYQGNSNCFHCVKCEPASYANAMGCLPHWKLRMALTLNLWGGLLIH